MIKVRTFKDLVFKEHRLKQAFPECFDVQASMVFDNGFDISVINSNGSRVFNNIFQVAISDESGIHKVLDNMTKKKISNLIKHMECLTPDGVRIMILKW
ncbi:hypothetical protein [uncultured Arcobacter sp.]|uniref:hypothetical protein n=1 Tax=uncultured Arcobacter sp. TaxID=165434 RepID=UPI002625BE54|nr:hypothetical protein [uncultured Arcobacter sp.]